MTGSASFRVVLVGAGHAHLHVASHATALFREGIQLTMIDPGRFWYSGMAAGLFTGDYQLEETSLHPQHLIPEGKGRFIAATMESLYPKAKTIKISTGEELEYDLLSLNIGSEIAIPFPVSGNRIRTVKPICNFPQILQEITQAGPKHVCIVGGGATGCEVAACLASGCKEQNLSTRFSLLTRGNRLLSQHPKAASIKMNTVLAKLGVNVHLNAELEKIEDQDAQLKQRDSITADLFLLATGLRPGSLIQDLPLPPGDTGGVLIQSTLQSVSEPAVFAVGDCADFATRPLPKLGVYGVRQGPILLENIRRTIQARKLKKYRPQKRSLQIIQTGIKRGLFIYNPIVFEGRAAFRIKNWIDTKFLSQYR